LKVQLWSYNYDPEPTGIGPVSKVLAEDLRERGHEVRVIAAHPHYPSPEWGQRLLPYREVRQEVEVLRLPLWVGRATSGQRVRQELTFMAALSAAAPTLGTPDVMVCASPSFPALLPSMVNAGVRGVPWILWLHDILPDGAASTGLLEEGGLLLRSARRLERSAYRRANRIVVLSEAFGRNLEAKGVPREKIRLIYDPATRSPRNERARSVLGRPRLLSMGNIGFSQGLAELVEAFEADSSIEADLVITGNGVAAGDVKAALRTDRVQMRGLVSDDELEAELAKATIALVTQRYEGAEFNVPSKLMNFMAYGLPVLAAVNPESEVAQIVKRSGGGWVADSSDPLSFPRRVAEALSDPEDIARRGRAAREHASREFTTRAFGASFEAVLQEAAAGRAASG
jgi:colanic acid biosynthesis glycosyl transferase WcaI